MQLIFFKYLLLAHFHVKSLKQEERVRTQNSFLRAKYSLFFFGRVGGRKLPETRRLIAYCFGSKRPEPRSLGGGGSGQTLAEHQHGCRFHFQVGCAFSQ